MDDESGSRGEAGTSVAPRGEERAEPAQRADADAEAQDVVPEPKNRLARPRAPTNDDDGKTKKRQRRTYSREERELVIKADAEGGRTSRLEAAARIGMPIKTADNLIARYESQGRVSVDLRGKNGGHQVKMEPFQGLLVLDRLHLSSGLMLRQLQLYLNAETLRILLLRKGAALSAEERLVGGPLDEERFLKSYPEVAEMYRSSIIMSPQTVGNWLSRVFSTKRHVLLTGADGATKANEPSIRRQRFKFARALRSTLLEEDRGEAAKSFLVFIDDALIESIDHRTRLSKLAGTGIQARDGEEQVAAVAPPPGGVHSGGLRSDRVVLRMQAALAVNPKLGVLHSALYNADNLVQVEPEGGATTMYRDSWHASPFCEFLDDVLQSIHKRRYTLAGKRVFLVLDAAHEHGLECSTASLVRGLPSFARTKEALAHLDGELRILEMPPCSPQLNLAGYCLRSLRDLANAERAAELVDLERASASTRPVRLAEILKSTMRIEPPLEPSRARLAQLLDDVVAGEGYLDAPHAAFEVPPAPSAAEFTVSCAQTRSAAAPP